MRHLKKKFKPTDAEISLLEKLRRNPAMLERIQPILNIADDPDAEVDVHQVEKLLVDEIRHLGNETLASWSQKAESQAASQQRAKHKTFQQREKKDSDFGPPSDKSP